MEHGPILPHPNDSAREYALQPRSLEEHGVEGEGVAPEWVIDHLFAHYWADYEQMTPDAQNNRCAMS